jgi:uncharacterized membrane protein YqjE
MLIPRLAPIAVRHLSAYVDLATADLQVLAKLLVRRLVVVAIAMAATLVSLLLACTWVITSAWDTSWRNQSIGLLLLLFMVLAAASAGFASRRWGVDQHPFARLRDEWQCDQQLISELSGTRSVAESGQDT